VRGAGEGLLIGSLKLRAVRGSFEALVGGKNVSGCWISGYRDMDCRMASR
jgi:hypothetical protein